MDTEHRNKDIYDPRHRLANSDGGDSVKPQRRIALTFPSVPAGLPRKGRPAGVMRKKAKALEADDGDAAE